MPRTAAATVAIMLCALAPAPSASADVDLASPGPYAPGSMGVTIARPNGTSFAATLHYPAASAEPGAPIDLAGAPYPAIVFGHGFVQPVSQYASTLDHLATHGFLVVAPRSEGGLFPSHSGLAADLRFTLDWLENAGADPDAFLAGAVDAARFGALGHSMGGGCAILATKDDGRIDVLATLAAAETTPSSIAAMSQVGVPVLLLAGTQDSIVPPASSVTPMYDNADAPRQKRLIVGGFHCGFVDAGFIFCDSGTISREEQLEFTRRELAQFLLLHLGDGAWSPVWGDDATPSPGLEVTLDAGFELHVEPALLLLGPGSTATSKVTIVNHGPLPSAFALFADAIEGWALSIEPELTGVVDPGATVTATLTAVASAAAGDLATVVVSARREVDGATRAWTTLELDARAPTPDLNGDGAVNGADLGILLADWGKGPSHADLNEDGVVDGADVGLLLSAW